MTPILHHADCRDALREMPENSVSAVITDHPYGLSDHGEIEPILREWLGLGAHTGKPRSSPRKAMWNRYFCTDCGEEFTWEIGPLMCPTEECLNNHKGHVVGLSPGETPEKWYAEIATGGTKPWRHKYWPIPKKIQDKIDAAMQATLLTP